MFERFTREARGTVVAAQQAAQDVASRTVDTRHLLVALAEGVGPAAAALRGGGVDVVRLARALRADLAADGLDEEALASLGIDLAAVRERADAAFGPGALDRAGRRPGHSLGRMPFARDAKTSLELALRETLRLQEKAMDGRHLLLGILRADCPGRRALVADGVDIRELRRSLEPIEATR